MEEKGLNYELCSGYVSRDNPSLVKSMFNKISDR